MKRRIERRDLSLALFGAATGAAFLPRRAEAQSCTPPCYAQTSVEASLGITPTNTAYPADPYVDPRRYGADATGGTDSTSIWNSYVFPVAQASNGMVLIAEGCKYLVGALILTVNGTPITIQGQGQGSQLVQNGTPPALLTIQAPSGTQATAYVVLQNFLMNGAGGGTTTNGLLLQDVINVVIRDLYIQKFNYNLYLNGAIDIHAHNCNFNSGVSTGVYARSTTLTGSNSVTLDCCAISSNGEWGIDYDATSGTGNKSSVMLRLLGCDLENNPPDGHSTANGGFHIGPNIAAALGFSMIEVDGCWFENNSQSIFAEAPVSGLTFLSIQNTVTFSETYDSILINGGNNVTIRNCWSPATGQTWNVTCNQLTLENVNVAVLYDGTVYDSATGTYPGNVIWPFYVNVTANGLHSYRGRADSFPATLTGVSPRREWYGERPAAGRRSGVGISCLTRGSCWHLQ